MGKEQANRIVRLICALSLRSKEINIHWPGFEVVTFLAISRAVVSMSRCTVIIRSDVGVYMLYMVVCVPKENVQTMSENVMEILRTYNMVSEKKIRKSTSTLYIMPS